MSAPIVNCLFVGGGFGNQLFSYALARGYAEKHGCELHCNPWLGSRIFELNDPPITADLPVRADATLEQWTGETGISIKGYGMRQACLTYTRSQVKKWFKFQPEIDRLLERVHLYDLCGHIRHGDFLGMPGFVAVSKQSYLDACSKFGFDAAKIHLVSQRYPASVRALDVMEIGFLADFYNLMMARILFRANSSFSWWSATLGNAERVFAPDLKNVPAGETKVQAVPFVEGNWPAISNGHWFVEDLRLPP